MRETRRRARTMGRGERKRKGKRDRERGIGRGSACRGMHGMHAGVGRDHGRVHAGRPRLEACAGRGGLRGHHISHRPRREGGERGRSRDGESGRERGQELGVDGNGLATAGEIFRLRVGPPSPFSLIRTSSSYLSYLRDPCSARSIKCFLVQNAPGARTDVFQAASIVAGACTAGPCQALDRGSLPYRSGPRQALFIVAQAWPLRPSGRWRGCPGTS